MNTVAARNRIEIPRKCSFCKQPLHTIGNCSKRIKLMIHCRSREYKNSMQKTSFLESMKTGPRSMLELNHKSVPVMEGLLRSYKPLHIMVNTSYAKQGQNMSQTIWSLGGMLFSVSLIGINGEIDTKYTNSIVDGSELEQYISINMGCNTKYIYDAVGVTNIMSSSTDGNFRGMSQDPPEEGSFNVEM